MPTMRLTGRDDDAFIITFAGEFGRINAYTLASSLVGLADAAKAANALINPGYEIEIVVEAVGEGSFQARVRAVYNEAGNLFSRQGLESIIFSVIATFMYQAAFPPDSQVSVTVQTDEVVIKDGDTRIVVPRELCDSVSVIRDNDRFVSGVKKVMKAAERDPSVQGIGFVPERESGEEEDPVQIPRDRFAYLTEAVTELPEETREIEEIAELSIVRAILEPSQRRWEFIWQNHTIAAPVSDNGFYEAFEAHRITIAPGDALRVRLKIRQRYVQHASAYVNESYEVAEVLLHLPGGRQDSALVE